MRLRLAALIALCVLFSSCARGMGAREGPRVQVALGTVCSVNAYDDGTKLLYDELFTRLAQIEALFSTRIPSSDVSRINAAAGKAAVSVSPEVFFVLSKALSYAELSGGLFDPTVGPLVSLWGIDSGSIEDGTNRVPSGGGILRARSLVGYKDVSLSERDGPGGTERTVFLAREGMALDLGGIAKGYAADELSRILRERKVKRAVVNLGGNVLVYGTKKDRSLWSVGITDPAFPEGGSALVVSVDGGSSVVTSGAYERFFVEDGVRYHHILNPSTGFPAEELCAGVTVIAPSSLDADALSTIAFLLGAEEFAKLSLPEGVAAVFMLPDGSVCASENLAGHLSSASPAYDEGRFSWFGLGPK